MQEAVFIARLSRFLCRVLLSGTPVNVHVPNTGRLLFLREGAKCFLRPAASPGRKTAWDLFAAEDDGVLVCVDSLMPNRIAERVLTEELARTFPGTKLLREVTIGESRFDFAAKTPKGLFAAEVKGSTLVRNGTAFFPDAPSSRAVRHMLHLKALREQGADARVLFVVCRSDAQAFSPEGEIDPAFTSAFLAAHAAGVRADALRCRVTEDGVFPDVFLPLILPSP